MEIKGEKKGVQSKKERKISVIMAIFLFGMMIFAPLASAAEGGSISGTIYNSNSYPLGQVKVELYKYIDVNTPYTISTIESGQLNETDKIWSTTTGETTLPQGVFPPSSLYSDTTATPTKPNGVGITNFPQTDDALATNTPPFGSAQSVAQTNDSLATATQPEGTAGINSQDIDTSPTNLVPEGSTAAINSQTSDAAGTNTPFSGTDTISPQSNDTLFSNSQPTNSANINPQDADSTATNIAPSGTPTINSQNSNTTAINTSPSGTTATISSQSINTTVIYSQPTGSAGIGPQNADTTATNTAPSGSTAAINSQTSNATATNITPSGTTALILSNYANTISTNTTPSGLADPTNLTSDATQTLSQPTGTVTISNVTADGTSVGANPGNAPGSESGTWYTGSFTIDADDDGAADDIIYWVLTDNGSSEYNILNLSFDNSNYNDGNTNNQTVGTDDDEGISAGEIVILGTYRFIVNFTSDPSGTTQDAWITSCEWYTGSFNIDVNGDGVIGGSEFVNYTLSDSDSDGVYDTMDLSTDDDIFGEGDYNNNLTDPFNDERIGITGGNITFETYLFSTEFVVNPNSSSPDAQIRSKEWYLGSFTIDTDDDGAADDTVNFVLSDMNSNGLYDTMDLSFDTTYGQGTIDDGNVSAGDDEQINATSNLFLGYSLEFKVDFDVSPTLDSDDARITSMTWYYGNFTIDGDGDGIVEVDNVYYVLSDTDSDGVYDAMDISMEDEVYGEGDVGNQTVVISDDERIFGSEDVTLGLYFNFTVDFDGGPNIDSDDANITIKEWYEGSFIIDANGDGLADDNVYFVLSDTDSDGVYDAMDISLGDENYGEGDLNDYNVTDDPDDERIFATTDITLGDFYNFTVQFGNDPNGDLDDANITSKTWYEGIFLIDSDSDGLVDNDFYFVLSDTDSNGTDDTMDISMDLIYGQGDLYEDNVTAGNDERIASSSLLTLGDIYEFLVDFDASPTLDNDDARITSRTWYYGNFTIDGNGDGIVEVENVNYVLSDTDSDGVYEAMDISMGDEVYGEGDVGNQTVYNSDDERIIGSEDVTLGLYFNFTVEFDGWPETDSDDANITTKEWYEGSFLIDASGDGLADDNVYFVLSDTDSDGVYDVMDISLGDENFGEGDLNDFNVTDDPDDERILATTDIILGDFYNFTVQFGNDPNSDFDDANITSKTWYEGIFVIDSDSDGFVDDDFYFVLSDTDSNGTYDTMDISMDTTYGQGTLNGGDVTTGEDERITASSLLTLGNIYEFLVEFDASPTFDSNDARITSQTWYFGNFTIDGDGDGVVEVGNVHYVLSDTNSDGVYEAMDISMGDEVYGEGDVGNQTVDNSDDERILGSEDVTLGLYFNFTVEFDGWPEADSDDANITIKEWYEGTFIIDADSDGQVDDDVYVVLSDIDSDGLYDAMDITIGDEFYGEV
ncbi:MAG: hypothetical protein JSV56_07280, partial [Methanomassiliicoccales archaeon]